MEPQQQEIITGRVTDSNTGEALPGVTIILQGTNTGTATNLEGEFELHLGSGEGILVFSAVGFVSKEVPIQGETTINVELEPDTYGMEELVVT